MFTPETYSDYTLFNDEINNIIEDNRPYEFAEHREEEVYADEVEEKIRDMVGTFDDSDCGADLDTLTALRDRLVESADKLWRSDDMCDGMDIYFTWDDDAVDFYRQNRSECDDALSDYYGGPSGTPYDSALSIVVAAANCGLDATVRRAAYEWASSVETGLRAMVDEIDDIINRTEESEIDN